MANQSGFQLNPTFTTSLWWYKPDPDISPQGLEMMLEINAIQRIETLLNHNQVWIYYAATTGNTNSQPHILYDAVAQAFMADMENLFSGTSTGNTSIPITDATTGTNYELQIVNGAIEVVPLS
jgi:hypothetical protein